MYTVEMSPTDIVTNFQQWQKSMRRYVEKNVKEISYGQYMFPLLVASVSFFTLQLTSQRMFGVVGLHCARPLATGIGFATTAVNMYGADRSALTLSRWANLEPPAVGKQFG